MSTLTSQRLPVLREAALPLPAGAGSGFEEGRRRTPVDLVGGSPRRVRDSLTSYLFPFSQAPSTTTSSTPALNCLPSSASPVFNATVDPLTPPDSFSSFTSNLHIARAEVPPGTPHSLPLTPDSGPSSPQVARIPRSSSTADLCAELAIPLITSLFPYQASALASMSTALEIVTPPANIVHGFICDHQEGRTVYVHLPPPGAQGDLPETLSANFSEILRPHDPTRGPRENHRAPLGMMDIRESLTALLDLASDQLEAKSLVLALDKEDGDREGLEDLVHSLMYVGGQVLAPGQGALDGGWEWDPRRWVLVGIEL